MIYHSTPTVNVIYFTSTESKDYLDILQKIAEYESVTASVARRIDELPLLLKKAPINYLISDRSSIIFPSDILNRFDIAINTHPSLLPLHKGSYALFWSLLLDHPTGTTLHNMDAGIDTGKTISQLLLQIDQTQTFEDAYKMYRENISRQLFDFMDHKILRRPQRYHPISLDYSEYGSLSTFHYHKIKSTLPVIARLPHGWQTTILHARDCLAYEIEEILTHTSASQLHYR